MISTGNYVCQGGPTLNDAEPNTARDMLYLLFKRHVRIALITGAAATAAYILTAADGAHYSATARVLVTMAAASPQGNPSAVVFQEHSTAARTEAEMLRDPALIRALMPALKARLKPPASRIARGAHHLAAWWRGQVARLGLAAPETQDQVLAENLSRALHVSVVNDTDLVALRFVWPDPAFAADALNAILDGQRSLASGHVEAVQAINLAQTRLHDAQAELARLNGQIGANGSNDPAAIEREKERVASRIAAAQSNANALHLERDQLAHRLEAADATYKGGGWVDDPDAPMSSAGAPAMDPAFVDLLGKRQALLEHLPPDNPRVHGIDQQIAQAREHAYDKARRVFGARLKALDERLAAIDTQNAVDRAAMSGLDERLIDVEAVLRSRDEAASLVSEAARHADDVSRQVEPALRDIGFRVLSPAEPPAEPDFPAPSLVLGLATLLGLAAGLASALRAERSLLTIDRPRDITRLLHIPVLASVPELR